TAIFSHRSSHLGSFCGRLAFIEKSVRGRFSVFFNSSGARIFTPKRGITHYKQSRLPQAAAYDQFTLPHPSGRFFFKKFTDLLRLRTWKLNLTSYGPTINFNETRVKTWQSDSLL